MKWTDSLTRQKNKRRGTSILMREINTPLMKARKITGCFLP
jgi:hypothetical protein